MTIVYVEAIDGFLPDEPVSVYFSPHDGTKPFVKYYDSMVEARNDVRKILNKL